MTEQVITILGRVPLNRLIEASHIIELDYHCLQNSRECTINLLLKLPDDVWDWDNLSGSRHNWLPELLVLKPDMPWNWEKLSNNKTINDACVIQLQGKPWNWTQLSYNPSIPAGIIKVLPDKPWFYHGISMKPTLTFDIVCAFPQKDWDFYAFHFHEQLSIRYLCNVFNDSAWVWKAVSSSYEIDTQFVHTYHFKPFEWGGRFVQGAQGFEDSGWTGISGNTRLDVETLYWHFPNKEWKWTGLSKNPRITANFVRETIEKPWHYKGLSINPSIDTDLVRLTHNRRWFWDLLSKNPIIDLSLVMDMVNKPWDWTRVCTTLNFAESTHLIWQMPDKEWPNYIRKRANRCKDLVKNAIMHWRHMTYRPGSKRFMLAGKEFENIVKKQRV